MAGLTYLLKKKGASQGEIELIQGYVKNHLAEGLSGKEAKRQAVLDVIQDLDDEYESITNQVKQGAK